MRRTVRTRDALREKASLPFASDNRSCRWTAFAFPLCGKAYVFRSTASPFPLTPDNQGVRTAFSVFWAFSIPLSNILNFLTVLLKHPEITMELSGSSLIPDLPIGNQAAFRQQDKQVSRIEANFHRFVHNEHMAHILLSAAYFVLAFENQDTVRYQHPVRFLQAIGIELVQFFLVWIDTKPSVDDIPLTAFQRFSCCCEKRRIKNHALQTVSGYW